MVVEAKLYQRKALELLINESYKVIDNAPKKSKTVLITEDDKAVLFEMVSALTEMLSAYQNQVSIMKLSKDYLNINYQVIRRFCMKEDLYSMSIEKTYDILDRCQEVANTHIGTLKSFENTSDKTLVLN